MWENSSPKSDDILGYFFVKHIHLNEQFPSIAFQKFIMGGGIDFLTLIEL
jgi:hypothetical protein